MSFLARYWREIAVFTGGLALDQASKIIMHALIFNPPRQIVLLPFLNFSPAYNTGVSFGLFGGSGEAVRIALTLFAIAVAVALPYISREWLPIPRYGAIMLASGALGNAIDRIYLGKVIDFIDVHVAGWHWPAFNVADSFIVVGVGLIVLSTWLHGDGRKGNTK